MVRTAATGSRCGHGEADLGALWHELRSAAGALVLAADTDDSSSSDTAGAAYRLGRHAARLVEVIDELAEMLETAAEPAVSACPLAPAHPVCPLRSLPAATVERLSRNLVAEATGTVGHGDVVVDSLAHLVLVRGRPVVLPLQEYRLLQLLASREHQALGFDQLARHGRPLPARRVTVQSHVYRIRRTIEPDPRHPVYLVSVAGTGYRLDPCGRPACERAAPTAPTG